MKVKKLQIFLDKKTPKTCDEIVLDEKGIVGDMYYGGDGTQVTVLGEECANEIAANTDTGLCFKRYKPNILIEGYQVKDHKKGTQFKVGEATLEIIGYKGCFPEDCELAKNHIACPLQRGAGFARVIKGGKIKIGDEAE